MAKLSTENLAKLACLYAGAIWGIFWMPLRAINESGIDGVWSVAIWFAVPTLLLVPFAIYRWKSIRAGGLNLQITAFLSGLALLCYTLAFLYTDVLRAMLLYYLTPIWSTLLAAAILGDNITVERVFAIMLAAAGMLVIFGLGMNLPLPRNVGDWMGISSGIIWAIAIVRIRKHQSLSAIDMTIGFFFWSLVVASILCLVLINDETPSIPQLYSIIPWLAAFMILFVIPGAFTSLWGPKFVSPGLASLLMMTEIIFGSISAALFADEPFGQREIIGILLISSASLVEPLRDLANSRSTKRVQSTSVKDQNTR